MDKVLGQATGFISFSEKGEKGDTGPAAVIISTTRYYALTTGTNQPTSWSYTMPDINTSANKGKFLWIKTVYTWNTAFTTENITCTYIGKDGASGTSVTIKGSFTSTDDLPTSGVNLGDGYIIGGDLWVYTGTEASDKTHAKGFEDVGQIKGDPGAGATQYYMHIAWMKGSDGTGFTTSNPDGEAYDYIGILVDTNPEDSTLYGDYNWTYVKGGKGDPGKKGTSVIGTDVTYQIGSSSTEPPTGDWHVDVQDITDEMPYLWTRTVFNYDDGTHSNPSYSVAARGTKGAVIRQHNGFESGEYKYLAGVGAEEYLDMVLVSGKWYRCTSTYTASSPSVTDGHWSIVNNYTAIATQLLLADNATINMASSQQVNLTDSDGNLFGSFRHVANDEDIALWLGNKDASSAPFYVRKDGYVSMTNANIYGKVTATDGRIGCFDIESFEVGDKQFCKLAAQFEGTDYSPYCAINIDYVGLGVHSGSMSNNGGDVQIGKYSGLMSGVPYWSNGLLKVEGDFGGGASIAQAGIYCSINGKSGYTAIGVKSYVSGGANNYAFYAESGDFKAESGVFDGVMRPKTIRVSGTSRTLTAADYYVVCVNTSELTLTLPSSPVAGQCYKIIQRGAKVTVVPGGRQNMYVKNIKDNGSTSSFYSGTYMQVTDILFDGTDWLITFHN